MDIDGLEALVAEAYRTGNPDRASVIRTEAAALGEATTARENAVLGGAWLVAYKLGADPSDLDRAIGHLQRAYVEAPSASRAVNLASSLLELNDLPNSGPDAARLIRHQAAVSLLRDAMSATDPSTTHWVTRQTTLVGAMLDGFRYGGGEEQYLTLLDAARDAAQAVEERDLEDGEPHNLLGSVHILGASRGYAQADLDEAVDALQESVRRTRAGHLDRPARKSNLASALADRYQRDGQVSDLSEAVRLQELAERELASDDPRRRQVLNNLANAVVALWRAERDQAALDRLTGLLERLVDGFTPGDVYFAASRGNAGLIATELALASHDGVLLDTAISLHRESVAESDPNSAELPGRLSGLATALMVRHEWTGGQADLDEARSTCEEALSHAAGPTLDHAILNSTLASVYHALYTRTGRIDLLDASATLHSAVMAGLPEASPTTPSLLNNAALALNERHDRMGDPGNLRDAELAIMKSVELTRPLVGTDASARVNNLAVVRHAIYRETGDPEALDSAVDLARVSVQLAEDGAAEEMAARSRGTLIGALAAQADDMGDEAAAAELSLLLAQSDLHPQGELARPGSLLRVAMLDRRSRTPQDRLGLLNEVIESSFETKPAVALAAAVQLAHDQLALMEPGQEPTHVEAAVAAGWAALGRLRDGNSSWRHALAWQREARGLASAHAQARALAGDATGAVHAFEAGHAFLLGRRVEKDADNLRVVGGAENGAVVHVWATPYGGAFVFDNGVPRVQVVPSLQSGAVTTYARRLQKAARFGGHVINREVRRSGSILTPVLANVTDRLRPGDTLTWIPGGTLSGIPVRAWRHHRGEPPLGADLVIRQSPSWAVATWALHRARSMPLAMAEPWSLHSPAPSALPVLPFAAEEGRHFAAPSCQVFGVEATRDHLLQVASQASMLHVACHARLGAADPLSDHLLLSNDEALYAAEIIDLQLDVRLVVLSACDTARVGARFADEQLGLAGAFLGAGAAGAVASLWPVGDRDAAEFASGLGDALHEGLDPGESLRRATARAVALDVPTSAWAAYVLLGC